MEQAMRNSIDMTLKSGMGPYRPSTLIDLESEKILEIEVIIGQSRRWFCFHFPLDNV
jgi:hypothetical protein